MKLLTLITLSLISLNLFSAEIGEDRKGECPYSNQSLKREEKPVVNSNVDMEEVEKEVGAIRK